MPTPIIAGSQSPVIKPTRVTFDPVRGSDVILTYEAAGDGLNGLYAQFVNAGIACELEVSDHRSRLTARLTNGSGGFPDTQQDHWQLLGNELQEDIKLHPLVTGLTDAQVKAVLDAVDARDPGSLSGTQLGLFQFMLRGGTHFQIGQSVFKWTTTVGFNSTFFRSGGDELLYTTAQVISIAGPPAAIADSMPSSGTSDGITYLSWRRLPTTRTTIAGNRIEVASEWWFGYWSVFVYSIA